MDSFIVNADENFGDDGTSFLGTTELRCDLENLRFDNRENYCKSTSRKYSGAFKI